MPTDLRYVGARGSVDMCGDGAYAGSAEGLRGYIWEFSSAGVCRNPRRTLSEVELPVWFADLGKADLLRRIADADLANETPGRFEAPGGWSQRAYVTGFEPSSVTVNGIHGVVRAVLLDGVWRRYDTSRFSPPATPGVASLDLPHDLPHDVATPPKPSSVTVDSLVPASVKLIAYGPAHAPYVVIAGNAYKVDVDVPDGGYLTVDPFSEPKRVYVTDSQGNETDCFSAASRGEGEGSGSYIFEKVPPGTHEVSWSSSFGFDLIVGVEEGAPPWTS